MWRNACEKWKCSTKVKYGFNLKMSIIAKTWCVCPDTASVELSNTFLKWQQKHFMYFVFVFFFLA